MKKWPTNQDVYYHVSLLTELRLSADIYIYIYLLIVLILLKVKRDNIRLGLLATFSLSEGHKKEISILNIISNDMKVIDT